MKIVIAGAGEVGTHLARMLSQEDHEIVLLDDSPENLSAINNKADVLTVTGSAHSFKDLKETGLSKADLFIAVTPYEERNLLACSMASYLGVKRTIARINNSEFLQETYKTKLNNMGINELIYPESLAAKEIIASLKQTTTRQIIEFSNGKLILLGIKVRDNAAVLNKKLAEIYKEKEDIRVLAINRDSITFIPDEAQQIINGDIVFFITTPGNQQYVLDTTGKKSFAIKNIMFLGGSRIAQKTIEKLGPHYNIRVIEIDKKRCELLANKFRDILIINGDGRDLNLLKEEGIERMDAFIATTGNSETNILCCQMAKTLGIRRSVAEVENLDFINMSENMDVGFIINKKLIAASYIYRFTLNAEISKVKCLTVTDAEVFEFIAKPNARIVQKTIGETGFPSEAVIGGIIRGNVGHVATNDTLIKEGDKVVVFTLPSGVRKIENYFK